MKNLFRGSLRDLQDNPSFISLLETVLAACTVHRILRSRSPSAGE